jgi:hypothetical protein
VGCNCGKTKTKTAQGWRLILPDGTTSTHGSRLEAEAANVKAGGGGTVGRVR